jgi:hypothetical protein
MKRSIALLFLIFTVSAAFSVDAFARGGRGGVHHVAHRHGHIGVFIGPAWYPPYYYYPPPYYYPPYYPPVVSTPPTYIEQGTPQAGAPALSSGYWYYCSGSGAYYPYVKDCPGGWQQVAPQPAQ